MTPNSVEVVSICHIVNKKMLALAPGIHLPTVNYK
jgi:hypothetical protein